jgi:hypothetical protein
MSMEKYSSIAGERPRCRAMARAALTAGLSLK